jgi:hypothetical protein
VTIFLGATNVTPFTEKVGVPLLIALLGLVGVIVTAAVSTIGGRWAQATNRRRDAYAAAVKTLVAWPNTRTAFAGVPPTIPQNLPGWLASATTSKSNCVAIKLGSRPKAPGSRAFTGKP